MGAESRPLARRRYLTFYLADRTYAVPVGYIDEVVATADIATVPGTPSIVSGLLNVGGRLLAVVSMRRLLGLPDMERSLYSPLVILKGRRKQCALEVDGVLRITSIEDGDLTPITEGESMNDFASSVAYVDGSMVVLLSPDHLLLEQEHKRIAALAESAQQRIAELGAVVTWP